MLFLVYPYDTMRYISFLAQSFKDFRTTGSFLPSQRFLINKLIEPVDMNASCVIELGAGEGCVTRGLEKKLCDKTLILSFEVNSKLMALNKSKRPKTILIEDLAQNLKYHIQKHNISHIDYVISSLPLASLGKNETRKILSIIAKNMTPEGKFIQYQYLLLNRKDLEKNFSNISIQFVPLNIPPAFVYVCKK